MNWVTDNWEQISLAFVTVVQAVKALIMIFKKPKTN